MTFVARRACGSIASYARISSRLRELPAMNGANTNLFP